MVAQEVIVPVSAMVRGLLDVTSDQLRDTDLAPHIGAVVSLTIASYPAIGTLASITRPAPMDGSDGALFLDAIGWLVAARVADAALLGKSGGLTVRKSGDDEFRFVDAAKAVNKAEWLDNAAQAFGAISTIRASRLLAARAAPSMFAAGPRRAGQELVYGVTTTARLEVLSRAPLWDGYGGYAYAGWGEWCL